MNFNLSPRFQKKVRRRDSMREAQGFAVPHLNDIVSEAAAEEAEKEEYGKARGMQLDLRERGLSLDQKRLDTTKDINQQQESLRRDIADRNLALAEEQMDFRNTQNNFATGIGVANLGVESMGAFSRIRAAEEEAQRIRMLTGSFLQFIDAYGGEA